MPHDTMKQYLELLRLPEQQQQVQDSNSLITQLQPHDSKEIDQAEAMVGSILQKRHQQLDPQPSVDSQQFISSSVTITHPSMYQIPCCSTSSVPSYDALWNNDNKSQPGRHTVVVRNGSAQSVDRTNVVTLSIKPSIFQEDGHSNSTTMTRQQQQEEEEALIRCLNEWMNTDKEQRELFVRPSQATNNLIPPPPSRMKQEALSMYHRPISPPIQQHHVVTTKPQQQRCPEVCRFLDAFLSCALFGHSPTLDTLFSNLVKTRQQPLSNVGLMSGQKASEMMISLHVDTKSSSVRPAASVSKPVLPSCVTSKISKPSKMANNTKKNTTVKYSP
ncbi:hypothetical protein C9374_013811 [Naegleria lovaniensis]|uniref:Uncharacterized protein n=1 Tax=Naegleria lovaniensis TaxID=51637 RepID=A0AA88KCW9_NAELO|nr:uncharacterized protein C9374_013811 [Naegleria lovaniensis]KAG2370855.1 hypothetical protein C9374_013811 [Naegleria lovaniensis]